MAANSSNFFSPNSREKKGSDALADGLSENSYGNCEETLGIVQPGDVADSAGGEVAKDPVIGGDQRDAQHQRDGEAHPLAEGGILHVERGTVAGADFGCSERVDQKRSGNAAGERTEGQGGDSHLASGDHSAADDEHVVDQRAECRKQKQTVREQHRGNDSSNIKEDLRGQKNAREMNAESQLLGREAVEHPTGELRGEDLGEDGACDQHRGHHRNDDGESFLGVLLALFRQKPGIDGDECDGGGAAGDDVVEPVGEGESGDVGVGLLTGAEGVGDVGLADVSDHARERDGRHQQQCR